MSQFQEDVSLLQIGQYDQRGTYRYFNSVYIALFHKLGRSLRVLTILFWRKEWQRTPIFLPGEFHGHGSLAGYSSWIFKESDMTEQLTLSFFFFKINECLKSCSTLFAPFWLQLSVGLTSLIRISSDRLHKSILQKPK